MSMTVLEQILQEQEEALPKAYALMEPEANITAVDPASRAQLSIAISLKRIADFVAGSARNADVVEYLSRQFHGDGK